MGYNASPPPSSEETNVVFPQKTKRRIFGISFAIGALTLFGAIMAHNEHERHPAVVSPSPGHPNFVISQQNKEWRRFVCTRNGTEFAGWDNAKGYRLSEKGTKTLWGVFTSDHPSDSHRFVTDSAANEKCGYMSN